MRDRMLHDSLRSLTGDAAHLLDHLLDSGAEIPFEVGEATGPGAPDVLGRERGAATMFAYRPMTAEFVTTHADQLRALPTFENAAQNLSRTRGMIAYLRVRNEPVLDVGELTHARLGALAFLSAVWADAERFNDWGDRFDRAYAELESVALAERLVTTVFIPVHGVTVAEGSVNLGAGVELIAADELDPECADRLGEAANGADAFCSISVDAPSDAPTPMPAVRLSARALLTALRLFKPGSVALSMTAQADIGGAWHQVSLPFSGRSREDAWVLAPGEGEELRQFVNAVRRVERRTRVAWALKRFEMGLERSVPAEGLSDFLVALRALLESEDDLGRAALPARVSALCARDDERLLVRESVEAAFALERLAVDGHVGRVDRKRLAKRPPLEVIADTERHLRALLHDLVCGYLQADLRTLADEILTADGEPAGPENVSQDPVMLEPVPDLGAAPQPDPTATQEFEAVFDDTAEITAVDLRDPEDDSPVAVGDLDDNVWTLRPASEIQPAPEVSENDEPEVDEGFEMFEPPAVEPLPEPDPEMRAKAEDLVAGYDEALTDSLPTGNFEAVEDVAAIPEWDPSPERRPVGEAKRVDLREPIGPEAGTGFTFDFKKVEPPAPTPAAAAPTSDAPVADDPFFPIPEFDLPEGRGNAAERVDDVVDAASQRESFQEIMDENFTPPPRDPQERATTPLSRDGKPHLTSVDTEPIAEATPRIVHPGVFGGAAASDEEFTPSEPETDPQATVEYDVLSEETSAEEAAQLAWSEQFLHREAAPEPEPAPEAPVKPFVSPQPLSLVRAPEADPAPAPRSSALQKITQQESEGVPEMPQRSASSERDRTLKIGPSTIEFRPVVEPDGDDPDDFAGAV